MKTNVKRNLFPFFYQVLVIDVLLLFSIYAARAERSRLPIAVRGIRNYYDNE
jgi:hypothetical protein